MLCKYIITKEIVWESVLNYANTNGNNFKYYISSNERDRANILQYYLSFEPYYSGSTYSYYARRGTITTANWDTNASYYSTTTPSGTYPTAYIDTNNEDKISWTQTGDSGTPYGTSKMFVHIKYSLSNATFTPKAIKIFELKSIWKKATAILFGNLPTGEWRDGN